MQDETPSPSPKLAVSVIRMSHYDSDVFFKFKQVDWAASLRLFFFRARCRFRSLLLFCGGGGGGGGGCCCGCYCGLLCAFFCRAVVVSGASCCNCCLLCCCVCAPRQVLIDRAPYLPEKQQHDLYRDALQVYECYYPLQRTKDVAFEVGRLFMGLKHYRDAIAFFQDSQKFCGEHHISWCVGGAGTCGCVWLCAGRGRGFPGMSLHMLRSRWDVCVCVCLGACCCSIILRVCACVCRYNMGICYSYTDELDKSLACFSRSLEIRPDYHDALQWKVRLTTRMADEAAGLRSSASTAMSEEPGGGGGGGGGGGASVSAHGHAHVHGGAHHAHSHGGPGHSSAGHDVAGAGLESDGGKAGGAAGIHKGIPVAPAPGAVVA